jgi:aspartate aminotransferase-like enzyme
MKLFTAGPVACYPEVLEAMGMQMMSHRSEEYKKLHVETVAMLQKFLETQTDVYLFSSTGSFMNLRVNCVNKKNVPAFLEHSSTVPETGTPTAKVELETPLGEPITPDLLDEKLSKTKDVEAVTITHNETSVGLLNPLAKLAEVAKKHGKLVLVDAVSSMGGAEIDVDKWGLDVCFSSSQKCFGVPPGLSIGAVSKDALKKSATAKNKGWYFDFKVWEKHQQKQGTPMTSVIPQIAGMNTILKRIEEKGGKQYYFDLYAQRSNSIELVSKNWAKLCS